MTAALGATLTTAVRMIDRIHRGAADGRANTHPTLPPRLPENHIHVLRIADRANSGTTGRRNTADFTARKRELGPLRLAGDKHSR